MVKTTGGSLRVPMFAKFLIGNLLLAALLITGGYFVVQGQTRLRDRGTIFQRFLMRYTSYVEGMSRALASTADVVAGDEDLTGALGALDAGAAPPAPGAPAAMSKDEIGPHLFKMLSGAHGLKPDLLLIFTADGQLVFSPEDSNIEQDDISQMDAVTKVRTGATFSNMVLIQSGHAWEMVGVPVREGKRILGGVIVGVRVDRYMKEFMEASDERPDEQQRVVLVTPDGKIVASAFDPKLWPELEKALDQHNWVKQKRGDDERWTIHMTTADYDFASAPVEGFNGLQGGAVATAFLLRNRADLSQQEQGVPWKEIVIGIVLSIVLALALATWVSRPIKQFVSQSRQLLEGETDLTHRVAVSSRDETADLAENINQVFGRLHDLAAGVQSAAFQVGASSAEISAASKQMLAGLKDQTMKIEGSTAAVTELSASIQQVAANAAQATDVAEKSNVAVTAAVSRMQQIRGAVEDAAEKMKELGESSKRIGNIVEVIRQISEQTSLLALNASIEAAHAGEQGRGFAVVADEVSSLARRVGQSAKDIEALIQTIKEQTAAAIASMDVGTREVEGGAQLVTHTLTDLGQLISVVKDTATAVQEQAVVSDEIARNMDAVQKIAGEVLSGSEESVVQAEQLHELAFQLEQSIGGFNLDGSGTGVSKRAGGNGAPVRSAAKALPKRASEDRSTGET